VVEIDAYVKAIVVPICTMIAAPLASGIHFRHIVFDLRAVFPMAGYVTVDSRSISLESLVTVVLPVSIGMGWRRTGNEQ